MKIIWHSAPPWNLTGYGVQTYEWVKRLKKAGHQVIVSANCQLNGAPKIQWEGIDIYPIGHYEFGIDSTQAWNERWNADMVISLLDGWVLPENYGTALGNWYPMCPVDTEPISPPLLSRMKKALHPIAMSKHAQNEMEKNGIKSTYLPHGVDCNVYKPLKDRVLGLGNKFVVGMVASNMSFDRKAYYQNMKAFSIFHKEHPDTELYIHADTTEKDSGFDLHKIAKYFGIEILNPDFWQLREGILPERMAQIYNSFNVLLMASKSEGFGVPLIESQACGVPVITTKHSAMKENCGAGWLVDCDDQWMQLDATWGVPKVEDIVEALEMAYQNRDNKELKNQARAFATQYDFDYQFETNWLPFLKEVENTHRHRWSNVLLRGKDNIYSAPCMDKNCEAELTVVGNERFISPTGYAMAINGMKLDIEDDPNGGVAKIICREIERDYDLNFPAKKGDVFIDVGAHVGVVSIYLAKKHPLARIIAVEPNPDNAMRLIRNLEANGVDNVQVEQLAIAGEEKDIVIHGDRSLNTGGHSMYTEGGNDQYLIHAITLEQLMKKHNIRKVALLKIDCEGAEHEALQDISVLKKIKRIRGEFHSSKKHGLNVEKLLAHVKNYVGDVKVSECEIA